MENKVFGKVAVEVVAWMVFPLTSLVEDYLASWVIRAEVEMAEEENIRDYCEQLYPNKLDNLEWVNF